MSADPEECISGNKNWLNWNSDLDDPNESEDDCETDDESDKQPGGAIKTSESPEQQCVSAAPNGSGFILPTQKSMKQGEKGLLTVSTTETRRNKGSKKM